MKIIILQCGAAGSQLMLFYRDAGRRSRMTSRTVSGMWPAALLQLHVVANDKVDETGEDDAG